MKLESIKGISLKTLIKTIGITAGATLAASMAQAASYTLLATETATLTATSAPSFSVLSSVYTVSTGGYLYTYTTSSSAPSTSDLTILGVDTVGVSIVTVSLGGGAPNVAYGAFTSDFVNPANVNFSSGGIDMNLANLTFEYTSPLSPHQSTTISNDSFNWGGGPVYVPNVPDNGTTALLIVLGLAGVGLGAFVLRRKSAMV